MKPVKSAVQHDPENGIYGDCFRACIASVFELPIEDVPHFYKDGEREDGTIHPAVTKNISDWVRDNTGTEIMDIPYGVDTSLCEDGDEVMNMVLEALGVQFPGIHMFLTGLSGRGTCDHSVVVKDGVVVHDPTGSGVIGPAMGGNPRGFFWLTIFCARV